MVDIIAYIAGIILMVSYLPQLIKTFRSKSAEDLSYLMLSATLLSSILYEIYACFLNLTPVIIMNGIFIISVFIQLFLKITYRGKV